MCYVDVSSLGVEISVSCNVQYTGNVTPVIDCVLVKNEQVRIVHQEATKTVSFRKYFRNNDSAPAVKCRMTIDTSPSTMSLSSIDIPVKINLFMPPNNSEKILQQ